MGLRELALMHRGSILVNTSRSGIVDEWALADALRHRRLAGAGLDVLEEEPMAPDHPLRQEHRVVMTPHVGGSTEEAMRATAEALAAHLLDVLAGRRPSSLLNPEIWDRRRCPRAPWSEAAREGAAQQQ